MQLDHLETWLKTHEPMRFDRSLERMERNRVITPPERRQLEAGVTPGLDQACRSGALTKEECESAARLRLRRHRGRVIRSGINHAAPDTPQKQALQEKLELERQAAADAARRLEQAKRLRFGVSGVLAPMTGKAGVYHRQVFAVKR